MRTIFKYIFAATVIFQTASLQAKDYSLSSPDGTVNVVVGTVPDLRWSVNRKGVNLTEPSHIAMKLGGREIPFGEGKMSPKPSQCHVDRLFDVTVPTKFRHIRDRYNELRLSFKGWSVVFRAYDNGVAYRFETSLDGGFIEVESEKAEINFSGDCNLYWAQENNPELITHCEAFFQEKTLSSIENSSRAFLPLSFSTSDGVRMLLTETDLYDYPSMFIEKTDGTTLSAVFPKVVLEASMRTDRDVDVLKKADYISKTKSSRTFPWRVLMIGDDKSLLENCLAWQLATPQVPGDASWIKPGKISWEWWTMLNVYGVDFKAGVNTETYKYYIDFAAAYGLEYILLDEGWSASTMDITHPKPDLDLQWLIDYGNSKGVGVVLWTLWTPMMADMEHILDTYQKWGVKGIKVDFMQRNDQEMVNFYENVARECFERHLIVDFHGSFKPSGLHRKYPNVLSYEGVYGMEHDKCSKDISPEHDLVLPFTRMAAGPMDYTPGATENATADDFTIRWSHPMSQGTRAHQAALFIAYESGVQMLCDSPSNYYKEPEFTRFIAGIPTVWDETKAIEAKAGDYLLIARRSGDKWYVAGLNDWTGRTLGLNLDFLGKGEWNVDIFRDGVNADTWAEDYAIEHLTVAVGDSLEVKMANGGGWAAVFTPKHIL